MNTFVLGLDGATFDCLNPLMDEGAIPNIRACSANGTSGALTSIFPPVTGPAWLAIASGLNPGKTGVFDYVNRKGAGSIDLLPISSAYYENRAIWDYLGRSGYKVGIYNYPTLSPPPKVNGFAVSGMGGYRAEDRCFPKELETELARVVDGFEVHLNLRSRKYRRNIFSFFDDLDRVIDKQNMGLRYLLKEKEWDFFFAVFHFTDWMQHILWKHIDEKHPMYDPETSPAVREMFKKTWMKIDDIIGGLLEVLPECNFVIVSDHGAGPLDSAFYANAWLERMGWLKRKNANWKNFLLQKMKPLSAEIDNKYFNTLLRLLRTKVLNIRGSTDLIDWSKTLAYCPDHAAMFGCVNLTEKGKTTEGFREKVITELSQLPQAVRGLHKVDIFLPEDIYSGLFVDRSPDIMFVINEYRSSVEVDLNKDVFSQKPSITSRTGSHRDNGVFIAFGEAFQNERLDHVSILDIAPTILALYDIEIPYEMDGRVITECIKPELLDALNVRRAEKEKIEDRASEDKGDMEELKKLMESLGYM